MFRLLLGHLQDLWENRYKSYLYFNAMCGSKYLHIVIHESEIQNFFIYWNLCGGLSVKRLTTTTTSDNSYPFHAKIANI